MTPRHVPCLSTMISSFSTSYVRALASLQVRVSTARRVSVARDVLVRNTVDLVVTDARMPGETGLALAGKGKRAWHRLPSS